MYDHLQQALEYIRTQTTTLPEIGIILGTGIGDLTSHIEIEKEIPYSAIPHFPVSTVKGHAGKLVFGKLSGKQVVAMSGRFHYYEGYTMQEVTFPVRIMGLLKIRLLIISNAAGSVNQHIYAGDLVFIRDHINLQPENPLRGPNEERLGLRFPDMLETYNRNLNQTALAIARDFHIRAHEGVYLALPGPNLETPAEYNFAHLIGADVVGMSTVPEVIVARHMNLPVFVASVATNRCYPIQDIRPTTVDDVIAVAKQAEPRLSKVVKAIIKSYPFS